MSRTIYRVRQLVLCLAVLVTFGCDSNEERSCSGPRSCALVRARCLDPCDPFPFDGDAVTSIPMADVEQYYGNQRCNLCPARFASALVPVCRAAECVVLDMRVETSRACASDSDCTIGQECCGCTGFFAIRGELASEVVPELCPSECNTCPADGLTRIPRCVSGRCEVR